MRSQKSFNLKVIIWEVLCVTKRLISVFMIILISISFLSCANDKEESDILVNQEEAETIEEELVPTEGGTLKLCMYNVDTLNPLVTKSESNSQVLSLLYDGMFKLGEDLYPEYSLCEDVSVSADGLVYSLKIRNDISFHSGEKLTAGDVRYSIMLARDSGGMYSEKLKNIIEVYANGNTVSITLDKPVFNFTANLTFPIIKEQGNVNDGINKSFDYRPNGTGMYALSEYKLNKAISLYATNSHFSGKAPYIKEIEIEIVKNREAAIKMLENSLCDVLTPSVATKGDYTENSNLKEIAVSGGSLVFLGINNQHPVLLDSYVRTAISKAIDRSGLVSFTDASIKETVIPVYPDSWLYYEMQAGGSYMPTDAAQTIKEQGWFDTDSDGILDKTLVGEKTNLYLDILVNSENQERVRLAREIEKYLAQAGVMVTITEVSFSEYQSRIAGKNYDMFIGEVQFENNQDMYEFLLGPENIFGAYKEELYNNFVKIALAKNSEQIKAEYQAVCAELINTMPIVSLYFKDEAILVNKRIKGDIKPNRSDFFANIYDWFIY